MINFKGNYTAYLVCCLVYFCGTVYKDGQGKMVVSLQLQLNLCSAVFFLKALASYT